MNSLNDIISNAVDLAGGTNVAVNLQTNAATLYALNVLADMELELSGSSRGRNAEKLSERFVGRSRSGTVNNLPTFIRFRSSDGRRERWQIIDIVSDIEDLTEAENRGRRAVLFLGNSSPFAYELSFEPAGFCEFECWGRTESTTPDGLGSQAASIPDAYAHLAANRCALLLLGDLMLAPNAAQLIPFAQARAAQLQARQRDLEHRWTVYRSDADNSLADARVAAYDPFEEGEFGGVFDL